MSHEAYWRQLAHDWTHAEGPGLDGDEWRVRFGSTRPGREHLMPEDVRELVAGLPDRIRVWRGAVRGVNEAGLSWAVSREDALGWADRNVALHDEGEPVVLRGSVGRDDVIALFVDRLEMEIVALPECVTVEAVEEVAGETFRPGPREVEIESAT